MVLLLVFMQQTRDLFAIAKFLFLLELCQISTNFNKFWLEDGTMTEIECYKNFHLTSPMPPHYLVKHRCPKLLHNTGIYYN